MSALTSSAQDASAPPQPEKKAAEPLGPLIEITPINGGVSTGYLLAMKEGVLEIELFSGEHKQEKTSELKLVRFVPPAASAPSTPPPATLADKEKDKAKVPASGPAATPAHDPNAATANPTDVRREEHRRLFELIKKSRTAKLTPAEETELADLREKIPGLAFLGGTPFIKQVLNAEADAKTEAGRGKLDDYITQHRQLLKDAANEQDARIQILRLVCGYKQQNLHVVRVIELLTKDIEQITRENVRTQSTKKLQNLLDVLYILNGEKPPK